MYDGKEKRRELINELRSTHALQQAEMMAKKREKNSMLQKQRQDRLDEHQVSAVIHSFYVYPREMSLLLVRKY